MLPSGSQLHMSYKSKSLLMIFQSRYDFEESKNLYEFFHKVPLLSKFNVAIAYLCVIDDVLSVFACIE